MNRNDERDLVIQALRDRLSRLSEASLRINESLDFDTVLQGVLDSARSLTEARYGAMTLLNDAVELPPDWEPTAKAPGSNAPLVDYFTSGLTEEQVRRMQDMPERILLFDYLRRIPGHCGFPTWPATPCLWAWPSSPPCRWGRSWRRPSCSRETS